MPRQRSATMTQVGNIDVVKQIRRQVAPKLSEMALLELSQQIAEEPDAVEKAFMARELVQCTLPHRDPEAKEKIPVWTRRNGDLLLAIQPGVTPQGQLYGYPFGTVPRLLLYWIVTEANRKKSRILYPGRNDDDGTNSLANFMRDLGMNPTNGTGKRSDKRRLQEGADRLFSSRISFHRVTQTDIFTREERLSMEVASASDFWWSGASPDQGMLWHSSVELGEKFYNAITSAVVPLDLRVIRGIKNSALALDLYGWACHRAYTVNRSGKQQRISWDSLKGQFGAEYANVDEFARRARQALTKIRVLWRKLDGTNRSGLLIEFERGGLRLRPGSVMSVLEAPKQLDLEDAIRAGR